MVTYFEGVGVASLLGLASDDDLGSFSLVPLVLDVDLVGEV